MEQKKKTIKTISIVELIVGIVFIVEGLIVATGKTSYFIAGAFTILTAVCCYLAADDPSKAKLATILLWVSIILNFVGIVLGFINKGSGAAIGTAAVDICISAVIIKLLKEING